MPTQPARPLRSFIPAGYKGKPYRDEAYTAGAQVIPGRVQCAYYDLGGEGTAYHDGDPVNRGSGELNQQPYHQRPHATPYLWNFRKDEGIDISYTKDFADFSHPNMVTPEVNQLYIGWTTDGEWCNYTIVAQAAGTYRISALYSFAANSVRFSLDGLPACECRLPVTTGDWHYWNKAEIGAIVIPEAGLHLLTFHYNSGNNFAYFEFTLAEAR